MLVGFFAIVVLAAIALGSHPAQAAPSTAQGLQISPVIIELNADKGQTYNLKLSVLNVTTGDLVFKSFVNDFKAKDETGNPQVLLTSDLPPSASVISWVQPIGNIPLAAKQTKTLIVPVTVPANAESGGHYGVIRFSGTAPEEQETSVSLAASAGVLLLVRVSGQITENLKISEFFTQKGSQRTSWFETGPVTFVERISNTGNVHVKPIGDLTVSNMFGKHVATLKVNETKGNILPASTRRFEQTLNKKWMLGKYTAAVNLAYGTQGKVLAGTTTFWVIPYKLIIVILIVLAVLIFLIRMLVKRYNRRVIQKAQQK